MGERLCGRGARVDERGHGEHQVGPVGCHVRVSAPWLLVFFAVLLSLLCLSHLTGYTYVSRPALPASFIPAATVRQKEPRRNTSSNVFIRTPPPFSVPSPLPHSGVRGKLSLSLSFLPRGLNIFTLNAFDDSLRQSLRNNNNRIASFAVC